MMFKLCSHGVTFEGLSHGVMFVLCSHGVMLTVQDLFHVYLNRCECHFFAVAYK